MIEFTRNEVVIGTVAVRGNTLLSDPLVYDVAQRWLERGNSASDFEDTYGAWTDGYTETRTVPNAAAIINTLDVVHVSKNNASTTASAVALAVNKAKYDSGGMIALIPSDADLNRLALEGEEPRDDLHLTLYYLGDEPLDAQQREDVLRHTVTAVEDWNSIEGNAFGVAQWNPTSEKPAWVLNVGDANDETTEDNRLNLTAIRGAIWQLVTEDFVFPQQHTPWQPHICIAYSSDELGDELRERLGPVTFDKVRVAFGRDVYDVPLG